MSARNNFFSVSRILIILGFQEIPRLKPEVGKHTRNSKSHPQNHIFFGYPVKMRFKKIQKMWQRNVNSKKKFFLLFPLQQNKDFKFI